MTSDECKLSCQAPEFIGSPKVKCSTDEGDFEILSSPCKRKQEMNANEKCLLDKTNIPDGYNVGGCNTEEMGALRSGQCNVQCSLGYHGNPMTHCNATTKKFELKGCAINECQPPRKKAELFGYSMLKKCTQHSEKNPCRIACSSDFSGLPKITCAEHGMEFKLSGCKENKCFVPSKLRKSPFYSIANCDGMVPGSTCTVKCEKHSFGKARLSCPINLGEFKIDGCNGLKCTLPPWTHWPHGYVKDSGCDGIGTADACDIRCAPGFVGRPVAVCKKANGYFKFEGCRLKKCVAPIKTRLGYNIKNCNGLVTAKECHVKCSSNFAGAAEERGVLFEFV